jgi:hypothetical protein
MDIKKFRELTPRQIERYPLALQALWYDYQDDWYKSHKLIDTASDKDSAWVHAYLHRKEGDLWNARYWYRRSSKPESKLSLIEERSQIARTLLMEI